MNDAIDPTKAGRFLRRSAIPWAIALACLAGPVNGAEKKPEPPKAAPVPDYSPAKQPTATGEFPVGLITITFKETAIAGDVSLAIKKTEQVKETHQEGGGGGGSGKSAGSGTNLEEYFKTYSNGITWPKLTPMPDENTVYQDPHFYGYYCEYDYWENPIGWRDKAEGEERVSKMNQSALKFATTSYRGAKPRFICYNYVTTRPATPAQEVTAALLEFYQNRSADPDRTKMVRVRKSKKKKPEGKNFDAWAYYGPVCKWGEPMWPNSKVQIDNFSGGTLAHELGHCLGAPDVYRIGRYNDGISGEACLLSYGPTANAFSRFYHHGFIKEKNHPTIKTSGTYTLHPRHIDPQGDEAVGYLIPSNHPHYFYQVEYIHNENATVGVGPRREGMLISVVNLGRENYLGAPDYFYVYRPNDPFFAGKGDTANCLFGKAQKRTEFNMTTEPSSRLPNLLDGGVSFKNIEEHGDTLTFDLVVDHQQVTGSAYTLSMLPQIRLDEISDIQPTSFTAGCTIKFRGEPIITDYGFCWSTSKNPTVRDGTFVLAHREWYRGHAINLTPNTTYYVRGFATNGLGVRYSDEEKTIKTPDIRSATESIKPLLADSFSDNDYLYSEFSNETKETSETFIGYSPTCVLAKLIAYYRPAKFEVGKGKGAEAVDFNHLSWNPGADDNPPRLVEIDRFFQHVYDEGLALKLHDSKPGKDFVGNIVKLTGIRSKPVLSVLGPDNVKQVTDLIRKDLAQSHPVMIVFSYDQEGNTPIRWALIDGVNSSGRLHVDFPHNTELLVDGKDLKMQTSYCLPEELLIPQYRVFVVSSCFYSK
ncbi:hypothetical protein [Haloferula sp. BvORR071]|uniref:hypothetical protein n=1 Tax=Haloferula sp. BvORR071 TaxID=1396141 RepID=UPI0005591EAB|nr:hypothetical protein [Haloferula sp. BvORR071]